MEENSIAPNAEILAIAKRFEAAARMLRDANDPQILIEADTEARNALRELSTIIVHPDTLV